MAAGNPAAPVPTNDDIGGLVPALRNFCGFCSHRPNSGQGGRPNAADADSRRLDEISSREVRFRFFLHWSVLIWLPIHRYRLSARRDVSTQSLSKITWCVEDQFAA